MTKLEMWETKNEPTVIPAGTFTPVLPNDMPCFIRTNCSPQLCPTSLADHLPNTWRLMEISIFCFHVRKTTGFERCRFVPPFFSIDRADSWCHVRPFPPRPPDFPWQRIPIAMVPSIGSSGNGRKINEVIICWAYVPLRLSLKPLLVGGLEHVLFHIYIYIYIYILGIISPTDFHIFQRGRYTTNQIITCYNMGYNQL